MSAAKIYAAQANCGQEQSLAAVAKESQLSTPLGCITTHFSHLPQPLGWGSTGHLKPGNHFNGFLPTAIPSHIAKQNLSTLVGDAKGPESKP